MRDGCVRIIVPKPKGGCKSNGDCQQVISYIGADAIEAKEIVIITPYTGQATLIESLLREVRKSTPANTLKERYLTITVMTLDSAQGQEFLIVIISLVRTKSVLRTFMESDQRFNMMISRAKAAIIFLGELKFMNSSGKLKRLLQVLYKSNAIINKQGPESKNVSGRDRNGIWTFENMPGPEPMGVIQGVSDEFTLPNKRLPTNIGSRVVEYMHESGKMVKGIPKPKDSYQYHFTDGRTAIELCNSRTRSLNPGLGMRTLTEEMVDKHMDEIQKSAIQNYWDWQDQSQPRVAPPKSAHLMKEWVPATTVTWAASSSSSNANVPQQTTPAAWKSAETAPIASTTKLNMRGKFMGNPWEPIAPRWRTQSRSK